MIKTGKTDVEKDKEKEKRYSYSRIRRKESAISAVIVYYDRRPCN